MAFNDYPIDVRVDYPERSSRGWAVLGITVVLKLLALLPHLIILVILNFVQLIVAFVAQIVVVATGEYPPGLFDFVAGVMRWGIRVAGFFLSLTDRYPPFSLQPDPGYPVDLVIARPPRYSRLYALLTVVVEILFVAGAIALLTRHGVSGRRYGGSYSSNGLFLRQIAALPHIIILFFLLVAVFVLWWILQFVILFVANYPGTWFAFTVGVVRWQARVSGYTLGLLDQYPPFTFDASIAAPAPTGPPPLTGTPGGYVPWSGTPGGGAPASRPGQPDPGGPAPGQPTPSAPAPGTPASGAPAPGTTTPGTIPWAGPAPAPPPAGWYPDPAQRHEYRYWDGAVWTPQVADRGQATLDPLTGTQQ